MELFERMRKHNIPHVIPLIVGGKNVIENTQPLCKPCNSAKHTKVIDYRPWWNGRLF